MQFLHFKWFSDLSLAAMLRTNWHLLLDYGFSDLGFWIFGLNITDVNRLIPKFYNP